MNVNQPMSPNWMDALVIFVIQECFDQRHYTNLGEDFLQGFKEGHAIGLRIGTKVGQISTLHSSIEVVGRKRLGEPGAGVGAALHAVMDVAHLERLFDRVQEISNWNELFNNSGSV
jgi:hypothetical protein